MCQTGIAIVCGNSGGICSVGGKLAHMDRAWRKGTYSFAPNQRRSSVLRSYLYLRMNPNELLYPRAGGLIWESAFLIFSFCDFVGNRAPCRTNCVRSVAQYFCIDIEDVLTK